LHDSVREDQKQKFDRYLIENDARSAKLLGIRTVLAIKGLADRTAASSVLAFDSEVWNRKQALEKEAK
jgi:hypothetical protein